MSGTATDPSTPEAHPAADPPTPGPPTPGPPRADWPVAESLPPESPAAGSPASDSPASDTPPAPVRRLSSRVAYRNPWLTVREDEVLWPDGSRGLYGVVEKTDFAVVLPRERDGFWLVEQYRYPMARRSIEFPMGSWPPEHTGGDRFALARAELAEETGLRAGTLRHLGRLAAANGYSTACFDVFLATDLSRGEPSREPTEIDMVHRFVSDAELDALIRSGGLTDAPSLAALMLYRQHAAG